MEAEEQSGERRRRRRRSRRRHRGEEAAAAERPTISIRTLGLALVVVLLLAAGVWYYFKVTSPTERKLAEMRAMPLVGSVVADDPGAADRLRKAIEEEARQPTTEGLSRPMLAISEMRRDFIAPALRSADDGFLLATMAARVELLQHLLKTNTKACREFSLGGIQDVAKLDAEGQRLYGKVQTAIEAAYRNGRTGGKTQTMPTIQEIGEMLIEVGFQKPDFDKLNSFGSLSNQVSCTIQLKLDEVPSKLPPEKRGAYARYVLGN